MRRLPLAIGSFSNGPLLRCGWIAAGLLLALPSVASAQFGPGGGMRPSGPGGSQPSGGAAKEEEGPAEKAPETTAQQPAVQPLPAWPGQRQKSLQFIEIHGYLRGRAYLFHNLNMGFYNSTGAPGPAWFQPYTEYNATGQASAPGNSASKAARSGSNGREDNLTSADMRLRIEPTLNVSEQIRVRSQIDIFDNYVMGTTPEGYYLNGLSAAPGQQLAFLNRGMVAAESGRNSFENAIRVKRAWGEVKIPVGELRLGRMPNHWGMGMLFNNGDCLDCDYGTNVDRVMFMTKAWGHFFGLMYDWVSDGPTTRLYTPYLSTGQSYNADMLDDVWQLGLALGKQDQPEELEEKLERGKAVFNYGTYILFRKQDWDLSTNPGQGTGGVLNQVTSPADLSAIIVPRDAWALIPNVWMRLNWRALHLELEVAMIAGQIGAVNDLSTQLAAAKDGYTLLEWGGVFRADYSLLRGKSLHLGLEVGYASGDAAEDINARTNFRLANRFYADGSTIRRFEFDPDYHVDLILFRRILGTVANATYFKPSVSYDVTSFLAGRLDLIYSLANNPVGYPGNAVNLGVEIDASIMYRNEREGFYAGIMYGVLFPLDALGIPGSIYGAQFAKGADSAQTFQGRMIIKF